jgi:hypothetical protein
MEHESDTSRQDDPLWEGELVAVEVVQTAGEYTYRDASDVPPPKTESPGVVTIGRPQVVPIAGLYPTDALPAGVMAMLSQADYFLVQLNCSFRPERSDSIDWARFSVELNSDSDGEVFAADMHPRSVDIKAQKNSRISLSSSLNFVESGATDGGSAPVIDCPELIPVISAAGVGERVASWDFRTGRGWPITGSRWMKMIVRSPSKTTRLTAGLGIMAEVQTRKFWIPFRSQKPGHRLIEVQLWPPRQ